MHSWVYFLEVLKDAGISRGALTVGSAALAVLWSGVTAAKLFSRRSQMLEEHMYLIMYPCLLMYSAFALLTIY